MRQVEFEANQIIFSRGDPGRHVYLVTDGRVRLSVLSAEGRELSFAHAGPGQLFGEIAALDGGERTAGATTISPVTAMVLSQNALKELIEKHPAVAQATINFLCQRLRDTDHRLEAIALHRIEVRLARLLLSAAKHQADTAGQGIAQVDLGLSQSEIGLLIGASRPKVNLAMNALLDLGVISRVGDGYRCDIKLLSGIADADVA